MHRHGYTGRKFHRERDQREALVKGLADSLVKYESIETTLSKAKEIVPYVEKLITKAKKGDLHNRRQIISDLQTLESAHKLVDQIAPQLTGRTSGHLRIERTRTRRGDNVQLARVSFVDDLKEAESASGARVSQAESTKQAEPEAKKADAPAKAAAKAPKPAAKKTPAKKETK